MNTLPELIRGFDRASVGGRRVFAYGPAFVIGSGLGEESVVVLREGGGFPESPPSARNVGVGVLCFFVRQMLPAPRRHRLQTAPELNSIVPGERGDLYILHVVDGAGYSTQLVLYSGSSAGGFANTSPQPSFETFRFVTPSGGTLNLPLH